MPLVGATTYNVYTAQNSRGFRGLLIYVAISLVFCRCSCVTLTLTIHNPEPGYLRPWLKQVNSFHSPETPA